jgi:asparagine synthase (glutamine-hydrolysing)
MCGLILARGYSPKNVKAALDKMEYRGKDGKYGITERGGWVLGHVRLAIQDLTDASSQPVTRKGFSLAYVGELFGLPPGTNELQTVIDTYEIAGAFGFQNFDGFWAIAAIHDDDTAKVFVDYLGQKPLYYWEYFNIVCSELDAMFELEEKPDFDQVYLSNVMKFGYDCTGRTPYVGIRQLAPGTVLRLAPGCIGSVSTYIYWDWAQVKPRTNDLKALLTKATLNRLAGDREVGLLLSGGLDSSIIYSILKEANVKLRCFSVENGESEYLPDDIEPLIGFNFAPPLGEVVEAMQCPVDLGSMVPQYMLAEALKARGLNVCLSGDGSDELFGGYRRALVYDSQSSDIFMELPYYHLPRLDRLMMRHTVELRTPFLAPEVIAFALQLPYEERTQKQALKQAFKDSVPKRIIERIKHPLKTHAVISGSIQYRKDLVELFTC